MKGKGDTTGLKPNYTFDELVVGVNNHISAKACLQVVKSPGETYNPLVIYGPAGTGKTHLMQAVAHAMLKTNPDLAVRYSSSERFMNEVIMAVSDDNVMEVRKKYHQFDLWLLDDIQFLLESKTAQMEFFHIFNTFHDENKQIVMACDRPPNKLTNLDKNIVSRLSWGLSTPVQIPDIKTRIDILKLKQARYGLDLDDKMLSFAAGALKSNVRELEGFLKKINAYLTLSHHEVNMDLVSMVIGEILPDGVSIEEVQEQAQEELKVSETQARQIEELNDQIHSVQIQGGGGRSHSVSRPSKPSESSKHPPKKQSESFEVVMPAESEEAEEPKKEPKKPPAKATPPPEPPQVEEPAPQAIQPPPTPDDDEEEENKGVKLKEVGAVFFFPSGCEDAVQTVEQKFQEVIKKHKLKFRLKMAETQSYECSGKINYASFVESCKKAKVPVAIVVGPPPTAFIPEQDFYDLLSVTLDVQGISLQLVNWSEINKDYRYLNLALDIALVRTR